MFFKTPQRTDPASKKLFILEEKGKTIYFFLVFRVLQISPVPAYTTSFRTTRIGMYIGSEMYQGMIVLR